MAHRDHKPTGNNTMSAYKNLWSSAMYRIVKAADKAAKCTDGRSAYHVAYQAFKKGLEELVKKVEIELEDYIVNSNNDLFRAEGYFWHEAPDHLKRNG